MGGDTEGGPEGVEPRGTHGPRSGKLEELYLGKKETIISLTLVSRKKRLKIELYKIIFLLRSE